MHVWLSVAAPTSCLQMLGFGWRQQIFVATGWWLVCLVLSCLYCVTCCWIKDLICDCQVADRQVEVEYDKLNRVAKHAVAQITRTVQTIPTQLSASTHIRTASILSVLRRYDLNWQWLQTSSHNSDESADLVSSWSWITLCTPRPLKDKGSLRIR